MNTKHRRSISGKMFVTMLVVVLLVGCIIGGTVAWLTDQTNPITNTFTYGDINITLQETTGKDYKIIPGVDIRKDPKVTVKANSEDCWLFVKVAASGTFVEDKVTYAVAEGWTALTGNDGVYYRAVSSGTADQSFSVLAGDQIIVSKDLTKDEIKSITANPTLTFTAYAVQQSGSANAAEAWAKVNP